MSKTCKSFCARLTSSLAAFAGVLTALAISPHTQPPDTLKSQGVQGVEFANRKADAAALRLGNHTIPLWAGMSVSVNLAGVVLANTTSHGEYEAALRLNLHNRYFPLVELGWGTADAEGETSHLHYAANAPFARIGMDYNVKKNRHSKNRVFIGARYGYSPFTYNLSGPDLIDSYWQTTAPFQHSSVKGQGHWGELVFGLEAHLWAFIHAGWSVRYKARLYEQQSTLGHAWYIPGYGRNTSATNWGGTFQLVFDLTRLGRK